MDPNLWGPFFWKTIHATAIEADRQGSTESREHFVNLLHELSYVLPCETCRGHMQAYLKMNPVSESNFFLWTFQFHNAVNYRLGKSQLIYEDALSQWSTESCGKCTSNTSTNHTNYFIYIFILLFFAIVLYKYGSY